MNLTGILSETLISTKVEEDQRKLKPTTMGIKKRWDPGTWLEELLDLGNLGPRFWNVVKENWYLGFTSFGGPPVHFKIVKFSFLSQCPRRRGEKKKAVTNWYEKQKFHDKFVKKLGWIDEQVVS